MATKTHAEKAKTRDKLLREAKAHVAYLETTLIPDLHESGMNATAEDFETCCNLIKALMTEVR